MDKNEILKLLESLEKGESSQDEIAEELSSLGMDSLGYAVIDTDRSSRTGIPEVIYSAGKTPLQVAEIAARMNERGIPVLATRAEPEVYEAVKEKIPGAVYHEMAKAIVYQPD